MFINGTTFFDFSTLWGCMIVCFAAELGVAEHVKAGLLAVIPFYKLYIPLQQ
jgi:hypothetical protein